jgi:Brp/Blh family beta-carotene 15,15'-monooxygenase
MLTLLSLLILLLDFNPELQHVVRYRLLLFSLVTIGILHGAVDHLLESGKWEFHKAPAFIVKYLAWAAAIAALWIVAPGVALVLFLLYSSLHFG